MDEIQRKHENDFFFKFQHRIMNNLIRIESTRKQLTRPIIERSLTMNINMKVNNSKALKYNKMKLTKSAQNVKSVKNVTRNSLNTSKKSIAQNNNNNNNNNSKKANVPMSIQLKPTDKV